MIYKYEYKGKSKIEDTDFQVFLEKLAARGLFIGNNVKLAYENENEKVYWRIVHFKRSWEDRFVRSWTKITNSIEDM